MKRAYQGRSLLTDQSITFATEGLLRPRNFHTQEVRKTFAEATARRTVERWLWLAGSSALLALAMLWGQWKSF